eukprot:gnl/MRDRNA2_/MRDRNA2_75124_c0_seq1.p1 gnl/MRDRNA2_/MRDRNA2_75124_c0~~gnl/MRDRNA2_/MRDRNA2_75124_c0_seq1.p1  ORF type:complete len:203 (+),score=18.73 gnl/MRDRNA2_/MRDRNA2_75124_c0_seq1:100-708(+)
MATHQSDSLRGLRGSRRPSVGELLRCLRDDCNMELAPLVRSVSPLQDDLLHQLPKFSANRDVSECIICLEGFEKGEQFVGLPCAVGSDRRCGGRFHERCLRPWLMKADRCPFCRSNLTPLLRSADSQSLAKGLLSSLPANRNLPVPNRQLQRTWSGTSALTYSSPLSSQQLPARFPARQPPERPIRFVHQQMWRRNHSTGAL